MSRPDAFVLAFVLAVATTAALTSCSRPVGTVVEVVPDPKRVGGELAKVVERQHGLFLAEEDYSFRVLEPGHSCAPGERYEVCR